MSDTEQKGTLQTLKDVIFVYTSTTYKKKQLNKENKPHKSDHADEFHGYEVKILISRTRFKALKKQFPTAKNFPNVKEFEPEDCVEQWGIPLPEEEMIMIKFTQSVLSGKAFEDPRNPKLTTRKPSKAIKVIGIMGGVQDKSVPAHTIAMDTNIGHGTRGHFQFNPVENDHGVYCYPVGICVTHLVPFVGGSAEMDESAFGVEELQEVDPEAVNTEADAEFNDEIPDL